MKTCKKLGENTFWKTYKTKNMEILFAIYSAKQAEKYGKVEYTTQKGKTVIVTSVSDKRNCPGCHWDDKVDMGR